MLKHMQIFKFWKQFQDKDVMKKVSLVACEQF
jgi:hypothetical protein